MFTSWETMSSAELMTYGCNIGWEVWSEENYAQKYIFI
jgi:hypothetical protein